MKTAMPGSCAAREDRRRLLVRMAESICSVVEVADQERLKDVNIFFERYLTRSDDRLFHPEFFYWYSIFSDCVRNDDDLGFEICLDKLSNVGDQIAASKSRSSVNEKKHGIKLDLQLSCDAATEALRRITTASNETMEYVGEKTGSIFFCEKPSIGVQKNLRDSLFVIQRCWPEMRTEIADCLRTVVFVRTDQLIGATDANFLGAIFVGLREAENIIKLGEEIVHEVSHNVLNTLALVEPICLNSETERFMAPLRVDPRPMFGIFHQVFVLSRLTQYYIKVVEQHDGHREILEDIYMRFRNGLASISTHARVTPLGEQLLASMWRIYHAVKL